MPEIGTSGLMSGDGKRGDGQRPQATAPILDSTSPDIRLTVSFGTGSVSSLDLSQRLAVIGVTGSLSRQEDHMGEAPLPVDCPDAR
jgi:hypothetical protein